MALSKKTVIETYLKGGKSAAQKLVLEYATQSSSSSITSSHINSINSSIVACYKKYQNLSKSKNRETGKKVFNDFMDEEFVLPIKKIPTPKEPKIIDEGQFVKQEASKFKDVSEMLAKELNQAQSTISTLQPELEKKGKRSLKYGPSVVKKLTQDLTKKQNRLESMKKIVKRSNAREEYYRKKIRKLEKQLENKNLQYISEQSYLERVSEENKTLKEANQELLSSVDYLEDLLNTDCSNTIELFDEHSKKYTNNCQKCVYELLNLNVSVSKVASVIECVLKLDNKTSNRLPSKSTIIDMNLQRLSLAQKQIGEVFTQEESTCLLSDETSKKGVKYIGYEASDTEGSLWVLGLRETATKSAADTLKLFKEILEDIDNVGRVSDNEHSKLILQHIVATMSDRAATEVKFNTLLEDYRATVMPLVVENFDQLAENEKSSLCNLGNFFCGLHALMHMTDTCDKSMAETEKGLFADGKVPIPDIQFQKVNESGTVRLVRTASKAFASGADEKSGCFGPFSVYPADFLKANGLHSVPLVPFCGSRFNILFANGASVFFLHKQMMSFLQQHGAENRLLKAVLKDLQTPEFIAGCKALGLICYYVTCPFWCLIEDKSVNILDMNRKYESLVHFFDNVNDNFEAFMRGEYLPFGEDTAVKRDCILQCLMEESDVDATVLVSLSVIFPALSLLCKHLFKDHLAGGIHSAIDDTDPALFKCVPKSNKYAESIFGLLDFIVRQKPNISTLASEAYIMFSQNKTITWIENKTTEEQAAILSEARKDTKKLRQQFKLRKELIQAERKRIIEEKIRKREQDNIKRVKKLENYTSTMIEFGLWQNIQEVEEQVASYSTNKNKLSGLKAQLNFRQYVLKQSANKELYALTKLVANKRVKLSLDELTNNVKELVKSASDSVSTVQGSNLLVGRRVKHKFMEGESEKWYTGKVISQVPSYPAWYNIKYDEDQAIYTYQLQED